MPDLERARFLHACHFAITIGQAADQYLDGGDGALAALATFDLERPQLDAAWSWATRPPPTEQRDTLLIALANATAHLALLRSHAHTELIPRLSAVVAAAGRLADQEAELPFVGNLGIAFYNASLFDEAEQCFTRQLDLAHALDSRRGAALALGNRGLTAIARGDQHRAITLIEQQLEIVRELDDPLL